MGLGFTVQSPHRTILTYFYDYPADIERQLEVGEVTTVPRKGDVIYLDTQYLPERKKFEVTEVTWSPDRDCEWIVGARERPKMITWVGVVLVSV